MIHCPHCLSTRVVLIGVDQPYEDDRFIVEGYMCASCNQEFVYDKLIDENSFDDDDEEWEAPY